MEYRIKKSESGKFQAILKNPSFGWSSVYTFDTEAQAKEFLSEQKAESNAWLSEVTSITDYFRV